MRPWVINLHLSSLAAVLFSIFSSWCIIRTTLIRYESSSPSLFFSCLSSTQFSQTHTHIHSHTHPASEQMFGPINWITGFSISINYLFRNRRCRTPRPAGIRGEEDGNERGLFYVLLNCNFCAAYADFSWNSLILNKVLSESNLFSESPNNFMTASIKNQSCVGFQSWYILPALLYSSVCYFFQFCFPFLF